MIKKDVKTKESISLYDRINAIEYISSSYFTEDENNSVNYTPYYAEIAQVISILKYFTDGVEFDDTEDIYETALKDDQLRAYVDSYFISQPSATSPSSAQQLFYEVLDTVADMVEYKKKEILSKSQTESTKVLAYKQLKLMEKEAEKLQLELETTKKLDDWLNVQKELNAVITPEMQQKFMENFNVNEMLDALIIKYGESEINQKNQELMDANKKILERDHQIIDLQTAFARKEQIQPSAE
jgi:hypothetical protein